MDPNAIALFRELADRSPAERETYYAEHHVDATLRAEVESLLRFDRETVDSVQQRVAAAAGRVLLDPPWAGEIPRPAAIEDSTREDSRALPSEIGEGRFPPGTLLSGRYRVVSLLGRGGMGEVYRSSDLKLHQPVALKFLPEAAAQDPGLLARLHAEVRLARQISHPNVCRVYDIGEIDGAPFISMEYIDGEDLASLLRRIGHLPHHKALEIARRLCAGLAAAHDKGVVHRDLKPANVMIDGRGNVFITDFGLASTARQLEHTEVRSGTPAYMAPEQLQGREVSIRSDLYALGLVFYEMFTGRRPFDQKRKPTDRPPSISSVARDLDPAVARAIERCLELDPRDRPGSALAVAAALPGGNALAEALAAGLTPSPQMVAAAHDTEAISVRTALLMLTFVLTLLPVLDILASRVSLVQVTPFDSPPEALLLKVRDMVGGFGYSTTPRDRDWSYFWNGNYQRQAERNVPRTEYRAQLARGQPPLVSFRYRQSAEYLLFFEPVGVITASDPPLRDPGDVYLSLDQFGRLHSLEAVPPKEDYSRGSDRVLDWDVLFAAAGVDRSRFVPADPDWIPPVTFDTRAAWTGTFAHAPSVPMRIEAASWKGRPVYFRVIGEGINLLGRLQFTTPVLVAGIHLYLTGLGLLIVGAAFVAWRNYKLGRSDVRGASRLGVTIFSCLLAGWILRAHHVPVFFYYASVFRALGDALTAGAIGGLFYMAAEPFVRRRWPQSLMTWTRLLSGRVRDSLVGAHVLVGTASGIGLAIWMTMKMWVVLGAGSVTDQDSTVLQGAGWAVSSLLMGLVSSVAKALGVFVLFLISRLVLRRDWMAIVTVVGIDSTITALLSPRPLIEAAFAVPAAAVSLWILTRMGVLPTIVANFLVLVLTTFPLTTDLTKWNAQPTLLALGTVLVLAIWSFRIALAGRPVLRDEFLDAGV